MAQIVAQEILERGSTNVTTNDDDDANKMHII